MDVACIKDGRRPATRCLRRGLAEPRAPMVTIRSAFLSGVGAVYASAFLSYYLQFPGLLGDDGLQPVAEVLKEHPRSWSGCSRCPSHARPAMARRRDLCMCMHTAWAARHCRPTTLQTTPSPSDGTASTGLAASLQRARARTSIHRAELPLYIGTPSRGSRR